MDKANTCNTCNSQTGLIYTHTGFDFYKCSKCALIYADVKCKDIQDLYESDYYNLIYQDYEADLMIHKKNNNQYLDIIEKHFKKGRLVEIGSAFGFFLLNAKERGWETVGFEKSEYSKKIAREKYNVEIENDNFVHYKFNNKIDLICMFDTIEHIMNPKEHLSKAYDILKEDGGIVFTTGNIDSFYATISGNKWRLMAPPFHIYYYSQSSIIYLLEKIGFKEIKIIHPSKYFNLFSVFSYLFHYKLKISPFIPIKLNLFDVMMVIAKK